MLNNFKAVSLSFKKAPLEIRELLSLDEQACKLFLQALKDFLPASDLLVLSTCNRTEVYYAADEDQSQKIIKLLGIQKGIAATAYLDHFTVLNVHQDAVQHLFDVAIGLEAQVVGDLQIVNQVKGAYQLSADAEAAGPFLHRLLHTIFYTNKRIVQETAFRDGAASVSYATVELVEELTAKLPEPNILVVGLGEIGADVCRNLQGGRHSGKVTVCNRTLEKSTALAEECGLRVLPFEELKQGLKEADVIISSIKADKPFFSAELLRHLEILSYKFFVDLAVPRSVDPEAEKIPGVLLYNIDTIQNKASEALERRMAALPQVREIISESIAQLNDWSREMTASPVINKMKNSLEQMRQEELARWVKKLSPEESKRLDEATRSLMQKVMKLPILQLKAACKRGEADTLIDVLNDLFNLEKQAESAA